MRKLCLFLTFLIGIAVFSQSAFADDEFIGSDIKTVQDHPALKRFEGSVLVAGDKRSFDEFTVALSKVDFDYNAQAIKPWEKVKVEGAHQYGYYRMPKDVTTLEALRNYENDLKGKGFETLWSGSKEELDNGYGRFVSEVYNHAKENPLIEYVIPAAEDYRYLAAKKKNDDGSETYVTGFFVIVPTSWNSKFAHVGDCVGRIDVLQTKAMGDRMVMVKAEQMESEITKAGRIALYGILFDFNRADIKPESEPTLAEIGRFLSAAPTMKLLVAGHTDNVGGFGSNKDLSERRAKSVVAYLISHFQIAKERLVPFGVSFASPIASNDTEDGKAKNRRVELVKY